jgi:hypothetical protein
VSRWSSIASLVANARPGTDPAELLDTARLTYLAEHTGESVSWWNLHRAVREWPTRSAAVAGVALVIAIKLVSFLSLSFLPGGGAIGASAGRVAPIALIVGFVSPMPRVSRDLVPRFPLLRSVVWTGLPVAVAILLIDGSWIGISATVGEPVPWPESGFSNNVVFAWLGNVVFAGLGYGIGHEVGRCMRDLSVTPPLADGRTVRRAVGVMDFLADAHDRGVLRRVGSAYQFRHVRIKESLAGQASKS